jgi:hypothetical protein
MMRGFWVHRGNMKEGIWGSYFQILEIDKMSSEHNEDIAGI